MDELANNVASGSAPEPRRNRGWFQRGGDRRINRDGRPKKAWADYADRAPRADRLKLLWVPTQEFVRRLTSDCAPWASNLPADFDVVAFRVDAARDAVAVIGRSASFPRIAKGAPLPEFTPEAGSPADRAPCDGPLKLLVVPTRGLLHRLSHQVGPYLTNCPPGCKIVSMRLDAARVAAVFIIRSEAFPLVARGAPLPEFKQDIYGVEWMR
jgi:hypothetical protein